MKNNSLTAILIKSRRRSGLSLILCLWILLLLVPGYARENKMEKTATNQLTANVIRKVYDNGLTLIIKPNYDNEIVAVNLFTRMGTLYEPPTQKGISGLMQRGIFYGGTPNRNYDKSKYEIESVGASWFADSYNDYGKAWLYVTKPGLNKALDVFLDIFQHPVFSNFEVSYRKKDFIQRIKTYEDNPYSTAFLAFKSGLYGVHPYSWLTTGNIETVESVKRQDLINWYKKIYIPNNIVISVVGNVNPNEIIEKFKDTFTTTEKSELPKPSSIQTPKLEDDIVCFRPKNIQGAVMFLGYPAPSHLDKDKPAMDVLNAILGGSGMDSRLFTELRGKRGLAYEIHSFYQTMVGPSAIIAVMLTAPANYQTARDGIVAEFKKFIDQPVSEQELQVAKKCIQGNFIMSQETSATKAEILGMLELFGYGYQSGDSYLELIEQVTSEDIQRVARKYFKHYVLGLAAPEGTLNYNEN